MFLLTADSGPYAIQQAFVKLNMRVPSVKRIREVASDLINPGVDNDYKRQLHLPEDLIQVACEVAYPPSSSIICDQLIIDILNTEEDAALARTRGDHVPHVARLEIGLLFLVFEYLVLESGESMEFASGALQIHILSSIRMNQASMRTGHQYLMLLNDHANNVVLSWFDTWQHPTKPKTTSSNFVTPCTNPDHYWCHHNVDAGLDTQDPVIVGMLVHEILCKFNAASLQMPGLIDRELHMIDHLSVKSPCQNGKTLETMRLMWLRYLLTGSMSIFMVSKQSAYLDMKRDAQEFNDKIRDTLRGKRGIDVDAYLIHYRHLRGEPIISSHLERRYCVIYTRVLRADNCRNMMLQDLQRFVPYYGVNRNGLLNINLFIDEAQLLYQTEKLNRNQLEYTFFQCQWKEHIADLAHVFFLRHPNPSIDTGAIVDMIRNRSIAICNAFQCMVEITATHLPLYVAEQHTPPAPRRRTDIVVPPHDNYVGHGQVVPDYRRIKYQVYEPDTEHWWPESNHVVDQLLRLDAKHPLFSSPYIMRVLDNYMKNYENLGRHILVSFSVSRNIHYDECADIIMNIYSKSKVPLVVICFYASSSLCHEYGMRLLANKAALPHVRYIKDADKILNIRKDYQRDRVDKFVDPSDGLTKRVVTRTLAGNKENDGMVSIKRSSMEALFPKGNSYTIRDALDLVHKSSDHFGGRDPRHLMIVTLGFRMMKEGVTVKTREHEFPPTDMIIGNKGWGNMSIDAEIQWLSRLSGRRTDGIIPKCHMTAEHYIHWTESLDITTQLEDNVNIGIETGKRPYDAIVEMPTDGLKCIPDDRAIVKRKLQPATLVEQIRKNSNDKPRDTSIYEISSSPMPSSVNMWSSLFNDLQDEPEYMRAFFKQVVERLIPDDNAMVPGSTPTAYGTEGDVINVQYVVIGDMRDEDDMASMVHFDEFVNWLFGRLHDEMSSWIGDKDSQALIHLYRPDGTDASSRDNWQLMIRDSSICDRLIRTVSSL